MVSIETRVEGEKKFRLYDLGKRSTIKCGCLVGFMVFTNIYVISWRSVVLMEDPTKTTDLSQVTDTLNQIML